MKSGNHPRKIKQSFDDFGQFPEKSDGISDGNISIDVFPKSTKIMLGLD